VKLHTAFNGLLGIAALLPSLVAADSQIQTAASGKAVHATAHVDFKIVIPQVLFLHADDARNVSIMGNSRTVTLSATTPDSSSRVAGSVVLRSVAGKVISQDAQCAAAGTQPVICTASMP
jgi:hypothetical protein